MLIFGLNLVTLLIKLGGPFYSNYGLSNKISFAYKRQKKKKSLSRMAQYDLQFKRSFIGLSLRLVWYKAYFINLGTAV